MHTSLAHAAPAPEVRRSLGNGITLITRSDRTAPRVGFSLVVRAGASNETPETAGWRRLLADAMLRAVKKPAGSSAEGDYLAPAALRREIDSYGGQFGAAVGDDVIEFWVTGHSANTQQLLQVLLAAVREPRLSDADIDAARQVLLGRVEDSSDDVALRATSELRSRLYRDARGELAAYGLPPIGTLNSLNSLSSDRIRELHSLYFAPARWTLAVAGDVDSATLQSTLDGIPTATVAAPVQPIPFFAQPDITQPPLIVQQMNTPSAWIFVANPLGIDSSTPANVQDWPTLRVLSAILGDAPRARLTRRLLMNRLALNGTGAAAYRTVVQFTPRQYRGELVVFAEANPQNVEAVKNAILDELRKLRDARVTPTELAAAKNFVLGSWAVERESLHERAYQSALNAVVTAGAQSTLSDVDWPSRVAKITVEDVQRVAQKYLKGYAVALVMPNSD